MGGTATRGAIFCTIITSCVIRMKNPNEEMVDLVRKLVLLRKLAIQEEKAPKVTYISVKKR